MGASIVEIDGHYLVSWAEETNVINRQEQSKADRTTSYLSNEQTNNALNTFTIINLN